MQALQIVPSLGDSSVSLLETAKARRDELLVQASEVKTVTDGIDAANAIAVLRDLTEFKKLVKADHTAVKAPVLEISRQIDAVAKDLVLKIEAEAGRIERVVGAYEAEQRRKAENAKREAEEKARRIADEAKRKLQEEQRAAMREEKTEEEVVRASDTIIATAQKEIVQVQQVAANLTPTKPQGSALRTKTCFEITNIDAFFLERPDLCTIEPNKAAINAILRANPNLKIAGMRTWEESKLSVR